MKLIYNIIGSAFMGLTGYFLLYAHDWDWLKVGVAFIIGFMFIANGREEDKK